MTRTRKHTEPEVLPDVQMTAEERAAAETEKAALLARLRDSRPSITIRIPAPAATPPPPAPKVTAPAPPPYDGPSVAEIQAQQKTLEAQLAQATKAEAQRKQAQAAEDQQQAARQAAKELAPLSGQLELALRELDRCQRAHGPVLKTMAQSCASGSVDERRVLSEIYGAAAPLGQRLGDARRTIESAMKGIKIASESGRPHEVLQAKQLAEVALAISIIDLEHRCRELIAAKEELRPNTTVSSAPPWSPGLAPRTLQQQADLGGSLI